MEDFEEMKKKIVKILKKNKVVRAGIFGSYARGEQKKNSDIDILVEISDKNLVFLDLVNLEFKLEDALRKKIDLLTYGSVHPLLKERILSDEVKII